MFKVVQGQDKIKTKKKQHTENANVCRSLCPE